jgi:hypothetical protein
LHHHLNNEKWIELYKAALLEQETSLLPGRFAVARAAITKRLETLRNSPQSHKRERRTLQDALNSLQLLERSGSKEAAEDQRKRREAALARLQITWPRRD